MWNCGCESTWLVKFDILSYTAGVGARSYLAPFPLSYLLPRLWSVFLTRRHEGEQVLRVVSWAFQYYNSRYPSLFVASACFPIATPSMPGATLVRPPPVDPSKSPIETVLELRTLSDIGPVII